MGIDKKLSIITFPVLRYSRLATTETKKEEEEKKTQPTTTTFVLLQVRRTPQFIRVAARPVTQVLGFTYPGLRIYLSRFQGLSVQVLRFTYPGLRVYPSRSQGLPNQVLRFICPGLRVYLSSSSLYSCILEIHGQWIYLQMVWIHFLSSGDSQ